MCGRYFRDNVSWEDYHAALSVLSPEPGVEAPSAHLNIAPTTHQPVVRLDKKGDRELAPCRWGLVPSWWKKPLKELTFPTFNARSETAREKPTFRGAFRHRRCLVPMSGFYEWSGPKGDRYPYRITWRNRRLFCAAGLWDAALIEGSELQSFTILTCEPNEVVGDLHNRMPVLLEPSDYEAWLHGSRDEAQALMKPLDSGFMAVEPGGPPPRPKPAKRPS